MPVEKSAGAVVFYRAPDKKIEYLLLKNRAGAWSFPKGLIEEGETPEMTAQKEVKEETGIEEFSLIPGFKETEKYIFKVKYDYQLERGWKKGENVFKVVSYFLFRAAAKKVKISFEHEDFIWLDYKRALGEITFPARRKILQKANEFLKQHAALS